MQQSIMVYQPLNQVNWPPQTDHEQNDRGPPDHQH